MLVPSRCPVKQQSLVLSIGCVRHLFGKAENECEVGSKICCVSELSLSANTRTVPYSLRNQRSVCFAGGERRIGNKRKSRWTYKCRFLAMLLGE